MLKKRKKKLSDEPTRLKPLRPLPGIAIVVLQWLLRYALPAAMPDDTAMMLGVYTQLARPAPPVGRTGFAAGGIGEGRTGAGHGGP